MNKFSEIELDIIFIRIKSIGKIGHYKMGFTQAKYKSRVREVGFSYDYCISDEFHLKYKIRLREMGEYALYP